MTIRAEEFSSNCLYKHSCIEQLLKEKLTCKLITNIKAWSMQHLCSGLHQGSAATTKFFGEKRKSMCEVKKKQKKTRALDIFIPQQRPWLTGPSHYNMLTVRTQTVTSSTVKSSVVGCKVNNSQSKCLADVALRRWDNPKRMLQNKTHKI